MLKGLDPLLSADLLYVLAQMGHGDEIAIVDANFPATSVARHCTSSRVLRMDCDAIAALRAVLTLFPLDPYEGDPVLTMQVVGAPEEIPPVVALAAPLLAAEGFKSRSLERFAFYEKAKGSFAILQTGESRPYGNFILRKGVINP